MSIPPNKLKPEPQGDHTYEGPLSVLEVHLDKIAWNYLSLKKRLKAGADCSAIVKADAYGLGAPPVAKALFDQGCRHFFVSTLDEAAAVRHVLLQPDVIIYVLNGLFGAPLKEFFDMGAVPVLNSMSDIEYWSDFARASGKKKPAVIHLDTGMNRLGLSAKEVTALVRRNDLLQPIDLRYIMSHLACADQPQHPKNLEQLSRFKQLSAELGIACRYSLANSAGILLGDDYHFDLVRPGCGLYGINPSIGVPSPVHGVVTLRARILQTRDIDQPGTVGYGGEYKIAPPAKCATISAGYADGYLRSLTGHGAVFINGKKCPVIGRVSMDFITVDISALEQSPRVGDWVEIIGPHQTVDDVAAQAGTIGYEILTRLGKRYKRSYTGN